jgi:hypothetical protein
MGNDHEFPEEITGTEKESSESPAITLYQGLRRDVSLLLAEGHPEARSYTLATLWSESRIVRQRHAIDAKRDAVILQTTIASIFSGGNELQKLLRKVENVG